MKYLFAALVLFSFTLMPVFAVEKQSWLGLLIDRQVLNSANKANLERLAENYSRQDALKSSAVKAGYAVVVEGKTVPLDAKGNDLAKATIQKSIKTKGFHVIVHGELDKGIIKVKNLQEIVDVPVSRPML